MALTDFGKAVRKARIDANVSLSDMANEMETSPSFLSALEMGRKKIPGEWVKRIEAFFAQQGILFPQGQLARFADVANKSVSLDGLSPRDQMLVAGFARGNLDEAEIDNLIQLLGAKKGQR